MDWFWSALAGFLVGGGVIGAMCIRYAERVWSGEKEGEDDGE